MVSARTRAQAALARSCPRASHDQPAPLPALNRGALRLACTHAHTHAQTPTAARPRRAPTTPTATASARTSRRPTPASSAAARPASPGPAPPARVRWAPVATRGGRCAAVARQQLRLHWPCSGAAAVAAALALLWCGSSGCPTGRHPPAPASCCCPPASSCAADVDECAGDNPCAADTNSDGTCTAKAAPDSGYTCGCKAGFEWSATNKACQGERACRGW